jgi:hypothetical protein
MSPLCVRSAAYSSYDGRLAETLNIFEVHLPSCHKSSETFFAAFSIKTVGFSEKVSMLTPMTNEGTNA